jgi:ABC-type glycerol-3-phosphate transport system permease component
MASRTAQGAAPRSVLGSRRWRERLGSGIALTLLLAIGFLWVVVPIGWIALTSLKERNQIFAWPPVFWPDPVRWQNYTDVMTQMPMLRFAANSLFIAVMNIVGRVLSCTLVGFAFARLRFPGRNLWFMVMLSTLIIPHQVTMIPQFLLFSWLGWIGTYLPLIVPAFFGDAFFVFLTRQYIMTIPIQLDEAARIDGASTWGVFRRIILPLCMPPMIVITVLSFLWTWNEFLMPLIYISNYDDYTIQLGLDMLKGRYNIQWNLIMAGSLLGMLPPALVYFFTNKYVIGGIANVGIKG